MTASPCSNASREIPEATRLESKFSETVSQVIGADSEFSAFCEN